METYDEDFAYIAQKLNLTSLLNNAERRKNQTPESDQTQSERIKKSFSLLDKDVRQRLYQLYRIDFEMFGFDASSYLWNFVQKIAEIIELWGLFHKISFKY